MGCSHGGQHRYIQGKLPKGEKLSRSNSYVQTVMKAARNCDGCKSFVLSTDLSAHLY